jgi:hypothetical protein
MTHIAPLHRQTIPNSFVLLFRDFHAMHLTRSLCI